MLHACASRWPFSDLSDGAGFAGHTRFSSVLPISYPGDSNPQDVRFATERRGDLAFDTAMRATGGRGSMESTMDALLGDLAFAAFILAQFAAVVAVHTESKIRRPKSFDSPRVDPRTSAHFDHLAWVIRNSGG